MNRILCLVAALLLAACGNETRHAVDARGRDASSEQTDAHGNTQSIRATDSTAAQRATGYGNEQSVEASGAEVSQSTSGYGNRQSANVTGSGSTRVNQSQSGFFNSQSANIGKTDDEHESTETER